MTTTVDIHAEDITVEALQSELRLHPSRLEEAKAEETSPDMFFTSFFDTENTPLDVCCQIWKCWGGEISIVTLVSHTQLVGNRVVLNQKASQ